MKIYFSGAVRAGRADVDGYREIIVLLKKYGTVLTEHIGDVSITDRGELNLTEKEIFERDISFLKSSDVLVAEVTTPSLGVGYEIGQARMLNKPVLCLYRSTDRHALSGMILGDEQIVTQCYQSLDEASTIIARFMGSMAGA